MPNNHHSQKCDCRWRDENCGQSPPYARLSDRKYIAVHPAGKARETHWSGRYQDIDGNHRNDRFQAYRKAKQHRLGSPLKTAMIQPCARQDLYVCPASQCLRFAPMAFPSRVPYRQTLLPHGQSARQTGLPAVLACP